MATYKVEFKGVAWATDTVEAEDESEAIEKAFAGGFPGLCAHCSGYSQPWTLEITDQADGWDVDAGGVTLAEPEPEEG
jgi:hypothetical protein